MARPLDPFRTLELPRDATLDDVKAAYRRLAKLYHPDSAGERALPRFLAVQAAYEALTEGPGRLRATIGGRRASTGRPGRPATDAGSGRSTGAGPRATRGPSSSGPGSTGARAGGRGASGPGAGPTGFSTSAGGDGQTGARAGSSRTRGPAGPRPRRTKRAPGSTSYDGAESEPFEPEWQGASWYGGSSGTYWTINPREYADPRKHGPEYMARGAEAAQGSRSRRPRRGDARPVGETGEAPTGAQGSAAATAGETPGWRADDTYEFPDDAWTADPGRGPAAARPGSSAADGWSPWPLGRSRGSDVSALGLIAAALLALAFVAVVFTLMAQPATPGAAPLVPVVAFWGIAIVVLVRVLRRDGRPRA